jgi:hypothetical protein
MHFVILILLLALGLGLHTNAAAQTAFVPGPPYFARIPRMKWRSATFARQFRALDQALTLDQVAGS